MARPPIGIVEHETNGGSYGPTLGQQLSGNSASGPSGCADNENFRINHKKRSGGILACGTLPYLEVNRLLVRYRT